MSCLISNGFSIDCRNLTGGIKNIFVGNFDDDYTVAFDVDNQVTSILNATSGAFTYYTFEQRQETASWTEAGTFSEQNGTIFYQQDVNMVFRRFDASLRNQLYIMAQGRMSIIVETQNGLRFLLGYKNAMVATAATNQTGVAYGDASGSDMTMTGKEPTPAYIITDVAFAALNIV